MVTGGMKANRPLEAIHCKRNARQIDCSGGTPRVTVKPAPLRENPLTVKQRSENDVRSNASLGIFQNAEKRWHSGTTDLHQAVCGSPLPMNSRKTDIIAAYRIPRQLLHEAPRFVAVVGDRSAATKENADRERVESCDRKVNAQEAAQRSLIRPS